MFVGCVLFVSGLCILWNRNIFLRSSSRQQAHWDDDVKIPWGAKTHAKKEGAGRGGKEGEGRKDLIFSVVFVVVLTWGAAHDAFSSSHVFIQQNHSCCCCYLLVFGVACGWWDEEEDEKIAVMCRRVFRVTAQRDHPTTHLHIHIIYIILITLVRG